MDPPSKTSPPPYSVRENQTKTDEKLKSQAEVKGDILYTNQAKKRPKQRESGPREGGQREAGQRCINPPKVAEEAVALIRHRTTALVRAVFKMIHHNIQVRSSIHNRLQEGTDKMG